MIRQSLALTAFLVGALSAVAHAQDEPTAVSPITVMPRTAPPKLTASYPAEGQAIAPGVLVLKVTFDQKMDPNGWSYAPASDGAPAPDCIKTPRLLKDGKTFVLLCRVTSGKSYKVALNAQGAFALGQGGFANPGQNLAQTQVLSFQVVKGDPVATIANAMSAAGLQSDETPIQDDPSRAPT